MLRFIAATVLVLHLLFMLFFAVSGRELAAAGAIAVYLVILTAYFGKQAFLPAVLAGLVVYIGVLTAAYIILVIGSIRIERPVNIWFHSFVFLPGMCGAAAYLSYVMEDRRRRLAGE